MKRVMFVCKKKIPVAPTWQKDSPTLGEGKIAVTSSGLEASQVDPITVQVMSESGIDISDQTSKPLSDFNPQDYDAVISLCGCGVNLPQEWVLREVFQDWHLTIQRAINRNLSPGENKVKERVIKLLSR